MRGATCTTLSILLAVLIIHFFSFPSKSTSPSASPSINFLVLSSSMATYLSTSFHPITTALPATSGNRISRIKPPSASASGKWWTPLFGLPSDPDYIHDPETATAGSATGSSDPDNGRSRFAPGCFTEEKAKQLRMKTSEMANFHDIMYHSAIASRLASDVSSRNNR